MRKIKERIIFCGMLISMIMIAAAIHRSAYASSKNYDGLKKAVIEAYKQYETEVDVRKYNLYKNADNVGIKKVMTEVINQTPYLFYTGQSFSKIILVNTNQITKIELTYSKAYIKSNGVVDKQKIAKTRTKINNAVKKTMKCVRPGMTHLEKAMVLHDYIISNTEYNDSSSRKNRISECGVFLEHKANCQGYSLAYGILMEKAGIPVDYVISDKMSHMWNLIKIGGKWYNVDVTWDDPIDSNSKKDQYGLVRHEYFMCSTKKFRSDDHYSFSAAAAIDRSYDNKYWRKVDSAFQYRSGKWFYLSNAGITKRSELSSGSGAVLYKTDGKAMVRYNDNKYYFIMKNGIYMYNAGKNSVRLIWKTSSKYGRSYHVTQIKYQNNHIYYRVLKGSAHKNGSIKVKKNGLAA